MLVRGKPLERVSVGAPGHSLNVREVTQGKNTQ